MSVSNCDVNGINYCETHGFKGQDPHSKGLFWSERSGVENKGGYWLAI